VNILSKLTKKCLFKQEGKEKENSFGKNVLRLVSVKSSLRQKG